MVRPGHRHHAVPGSASTRRCQTAPVTISVLTWNLWWRFGPWEDRQPAILATIRSLDADVICLQEVWFADGTSSAELIAEDIGFHVVGAHRLVIDGVGFGNAVLARWPITESAVLDLPCFEGHDEQRVVVRATVDGPDGPLQVFSTHLDWRYDRSATRQAQVRALCEFVADTRPRTHPPIVCGDFNAEPASDEIRMMTGEAAVPVDGLVFFDSFRVAGSGVGDTWSERNPFAAAEFEQERRIDYVFVGWRRSDGTGSTVSSRVVGDEPVDGVWPSDHFGVLAELRRPPA